MPKKAFDREKWLEEKRAKVQTAKEALEAGLAALRTSDEWRAALTSIAHNARRRFSVTRYSFGNQVMVASQTPEARPAPSSVATFNAWKKAGRSVKKGEHGMMILTPKPWKREERQDDGSTRQRAGMAFGVAFVFDIAQTEGKEIPEPAKLCHDVADLETFEHDVQALREVVLALDGAPVSSVSIRGRAAGDPCSRSDGWYVPATKEIVVISEKGNAHAFMVLAHEVAHALLHPRGDHHSTPEREVEAQSTAYIVCEVLGLPTDGFSFPYVETWAKRASETSNEMVAKCGDRITKAAHVILDALLGKVEQPAVEEEEAA